MFQKKRRWRFLFSVILVIVGQSIVPVYAQVSIDEVKLSGNYEWGEAFSTDRDEAIALARQDLVEGISVLVTSNIEVRTEERDENVTSEFQSNVRTQSQMVLEGLDYLDEKRRDGSWRVVAYISNQDLEKSIEREQRRLSAKLADAYRAEQEGDKNKALRLYFETFIESHNIRPEPVPVDSTLFDSDINIRQYSRSKLIDWLNNIELEATEVRSFSTDTTTELYIDIEASIGTQPAGNLLLAVNRPDYGQHRILDGSATIFYDRKPENRIHDVNFKLALDTSILPEDLRSFAKNVTPERVKSVAVDFEEVIEIDFTANKLSDGSFRFSPRVKNLSVSHIEWSFGRDNYSNEPSPRHLFEGNGSHEVTLTLNHRKDLSATKELDTSGRVGFARDQSDAFTQRSVVLESESVVPFQHRDYIERIRRMPDYESLDSYLGRLRNGKLLLYGGPQHVNDDDDSYIIITDPESEKVEAILSPVISYVRYVITEKEPVSFGRSEWQDHYRGYRPIWVEFQ